MSDSAISTLRELLTNNDVAIAAILQESALELEPCLASYSKLNGDRQDKFRAGLNELVEKARAFDTVVGDLEELHDQSGLLKQVEGTDSTVNQVKIIDEILKRLSDFAKSGRAGDTAEVAQLAFGHRGCVLLPYFDVEGNSICFQLDSNLLGTEQAKDCATLLRDSTAKELAVVAENAASRHQKHSADGAEKA